MLAQQHKERIAGFDLLLIAAVILLMLLSVAFVYSATMTTDSAAAISWFRQSYFRQIVWFGLGLGAATVICVVDYHTLTRWAYVAYWIMIIFLIAVLIPHIGSR